MDNVSVQSFELGESFTETADIGPSSARKRRAEGKKQTTFNSPYGSPKAQPNAREVWMKSMQNGQGFGNVKSSGYMADVPHNQTKPVAKMRPINKAAHLDKEQMYDEIQDLRHIISAYSKEKDLLVTKINKLQKELMKKDKMIDDAFNPAKAGDGYRVVGDSKKVETSAMVNSLKQKCHRLECMLREREDSISSMRQDLKSTRLQEQDIMIETYYEETKRLSAIIEKKQFQQPMSQPLRASTPLLDRTNNTAHLEAKLKQLEEDNAALCKSITETTLQQPNLDTGVVPEFSALSRAQLEQEHQKLQKRLEISEDEKDELGKKLLLHETEFRNVAAGQRKQAETMAKLREDRKSYQEKTHTMESELSGQKLVLKRLNKQVRALEEENGELKEKRRMETEGAKRSSVQDKFAALVLGMLQRQLKERERGVEKRERNLEDKENAPPVVEKKIVEPVKEANLKAEEAAACKIQSEWKKHRHSKEQARYHSAKEQARNDSAKAIQNQYRKHRLQKSVCTLQRVLRAHNTRLGKVEEEQEKVVTSVQCALKGYSVRSQAINLLESQPPPPKAGYITSTEELIGGEVVEEGPQRTESELSLPPTSRKTTQASHKPKTTQASHKPAPSKGKSIVEPVRSGEVPVSEKKQPYKYVDSDEDSAGLNSTYKVEEKGLFSELGVQMLASDSEEDLVIM